MTPDRARIGWIAACALTASACNLGTDEVQVNRVEGDCYVDIYGPQVEADEGRAEAALSCGDATDCLDRKTVLRGIELGLVIPIPRATDRERYTLESSDESRLRVEGFEPVEDACLAQYVMPGSVIFDAVGEAALIVKQDGEEIDRFTWTAYDAAAVELQVDDNTNDWVSRESYRMQDPVLYVRARVANEADERLLGGGNIYWWVDDPEIASLAGAGFNSSGQAQALLAVSPGETTLHVIASNVEDTIAIEVSELAAERAGYDATVESDAGSSE
jgi:hypothetical protein